MIFRQTKLIVADNSGARIVQCIGMLGRPQVARAGRVITVSVKEVKPGCKIRRGDVMRALVLRTKKETVRPDGRFIRFDDNAVALLHMDMKPVGTRIIGPVAAELRKGSWLKILSLSSRVL